MRATEERRSQGNRKDEGQSHALSDAQFAEGV